MNYSEHQDTLIALVSHLGLTKHKSRTPPFIAQNLGIDEAKIKLVLKEFPGLFRESKNQSKNEENYYTLQIRYALRYDEKTGDEDGTPLEIAHIVELLNFISNQAHQEQNLNISYNQLEQSREQMSQGFAISKEQIQAGKVAAYLSLGASTIAAIAAIVAAFIASGSG